MAEEARDVVDWTHFEKSRSELGPAFIRILTYFKEDGTKSVAQIEDLKPTHIVISPGTRDSRAHAEGRVAPARC